ncbi:poly(A) RNA polymerase, mitochondrial isoform X2 [Odontomachus brunneus]|uniref:poly(A) RNA polymerase, mitochondrial isoform X2 n=1 Tax=Odontomachus brunneus TaxID=486640 RepID=UPI0013F1B700|nr:poly(A) RNA polymerase, mitochondrial isoform X2 [Odontomachus brunneus]
MALFVRVNLNTLSLLNRCYNKFATSAVKLKTNKHTVVTSSILFEKLSKQNKKTKTSTSVKTPFEIEIANRRDQACRSILVQVDSLSSHEDLQNYCSQFGMIQNVYHYKTNKEHNYILVEFEDEASIKEIMSNANFIGSNLIIPCKSSVLWFRKGQISKQNSQKMLTVENGVSSPSIEHIAHKLYHSRSISEQISQLYEALKLTDLETRLRFHTAHHLEQNLSILFYGRRILPFGSSVNGFGRKACDLDLVFFSDDTVENDPRSRLVFHSKYMKCKQKHEIKEFMAVLANIMRHFIPGVENVRKILEARVPIIKFNFEYNLLECDLCTENTTAVYMSELLYLYGEIDWRVRPLVLMIRKWARNQDITCDIPGAWITNFSLSLLVLFYLQQKNILPSLRILKIHANSDARYTADGIDCTFLRDIRKLPNEYKNKLNHDDLETLMFGFFEYYSTYDFYTKGICIRTGIPIRKPTSSPLHIINPLQTMLNVSKNVSIFELNRLVQKAHDALFTLETANKLQYNNWGIMSLLKIKQPEVINLSQFNIVESRNVKGNSSENHSHETSEKVVSIDNTQPVEKTEETVSYVK